MASITVGFCRCRGVVDGPRFGPAAWNGKGPFRGIRSGSALQVYEKLWLFRFSQITVTANPIQGWANLGPSTGFGVEEFTGAQSRGF